MFLFHTIKDLGDYLHQQRKLGKSVGFVPTMGALHAGHTSLIEAAKKANDLTVCSIFVNPIQFNNPDDLARYPRTLTADCALLESAHCNAVFAPNAEEMYPEKTILKFDFGDLARAMEGQFRPGHFNGVAIVVSKLFHIVQPDRAYFGQKDLQQVAVVRRMTLDLGFQIELHSCPTLRQTDGLAMSSRNQNLTADERPAAAHIFKALNLAKQLLLAGQRPAEVKQAVVAYFATIPAFRLEYFEIVNAHSLQPATETPSQGEAALCVAAHLGKVRLIDNFVF